MLLYNRCHGSNALMIVCVYYFRFFIILDVQFRSVVHNFLQQIPSLVRYLKLFFASVISLYQSYLIAIGKQPFMCSLV
jgi:hypothetical protein